MWYFTVAIHHAPSYSVTVLSFDISGEALRLD